MICSNFEEVKEEISRRRSLHALAAAEYDMREEVLQVGMISGGFDPITHGHIQYINEAKKRCDVLVVIVNGNKFLLEKKGYFVLTESLRANIVDNFKAVDIVLVYNDKPTVEDVIAAIKPDLFMNGGDRNPGNLATAEEEVAAQVGTRYITGVGGDSKISSSKSIINHLMFELDVLKVLSEDNPRRKAFEAYHGKHSLLV